MMPRLKNTPPKLCHRKDNDTAYTTFQGKRYYLGKWGAESTMIKYKTLVAHWTNSVEKQTQPEKFNPQPTADCTLSQLFFFFLRYYKDKPKRDQSGLNAYRHVITVIEGLYPVLLASKFTPVHLMKVRTVLAGQTFTKKGVECARSRQYINKLVNYIRSVFAWGVEQGMVDVNIHLALKYVRPLREGETSAPESKKRGTVSDQDFLAILDYLLPTYQDIMKILKITGMRPSELCDMKVGNIDKTGEIWIYKPEHHKNSWRGKDRTIAFGKQSQSLLERHLKGRKRYEYVFTPKRIMAERWSLQALKRQSKRTPSQQAKIDARAQRKFYKFKDSLDTHILDHQIRNACGKAIRDGKIKSNWTLYELRHTAITDVRLIAGAETAQHFAGHSHLATQEYYDHSATQSVIELAKKRG